MFFEVYTPSPDRWKWLLFAGTPEKRGRVWCVSDASWPSEAGARSDVAAFRKTMGGVKFAKVMTA